MDEGPALPVLGGHHGMDLESRLPLLPQDGPHVQNRKFPLEVLASDGRGGWFAATSIGGDGPLYYIDQDRSVCLLSDCYRARQKRPFFLCQDLQAGINDLCFPLKDNAGRAGGDLALVQKTRELCPEDFYIWSGNDDETAPIMLFGGKGVISVAANVMPGEMPPPPPLRPRCWDVPPGRRRSPPYISPRSGRARGRGSRASPPRRRPPCSGG